MIYGKRIWERGEGVASLETETLIKDYLEDIKKIDIKQDLEKMVFPFCLSTELWEKYNDRKSKFDLSKVEKVKYFGENNRTLSSDIGNIPTEKGGIYFYVIENSVLSEAGSYIMYVGEAHKTKYENLRARARNHHSQYLREEENERLEKVFDRWWNYVYFLYIPVDENDEYIDLVEDELILALTPPCNKEIPSPKIRRKLSAFNYT